MRRAEPATTSRTIDCTTRSEGRIVVTFSTPASRPASPKIGATVQLSAASFDAK